ncbi:uncharacterized protein STEHIDRAFT_126542 [Stereum hirsutum FP-91666 SS1]|uniref:Uncharacterized protein n=1 Tax=Stereum hirsutum (strain FP-91666) TaxID=721885 RepID=R7RWU5_STEHR|nr:uncharacterized protein STEHIDRAFT_126542 [Stereum hirsutum FP-91666 SS1]EIM79310.1 hypothetical protein STEHIDRAFT_126542 [Stereum hirsutum FP-91666 SS1]
MSAIIGGWIGKLFLPSPASRLPSAPGFPPQPLRLTTPTATDQGSTSTKRSRNAAISALDKLRKEFVGDVGCFLTGYSCISLEVAHLVNPVRKKGEEAEVTKHLTTVLGITRQQGNFSLDSIENLVLLYPPYHRHLDVYATYALTLSEHSLQAVIQILNATNQKWEDLTEIYTENPPPRTIDWLDPVLSRLNYDIIILHPSFFLLPDQPLIALEQHSPRTYRLWQVTGGELRHWQAPDSDPYPPFCYTSRNHPDKTVNPFLLILNAASKLEYHRRHYSFDNLTERQRRLADLTLEAYTLIYYRPPLFAVKLAEGMYTTVPPAVSPLLALASTSRDANDSGGTPFGGGAGIDRMEEDENEDDEEERNDSDSESDSEELSTDEVYGIVTKIEDPRTTLDERKELGLLLLSGGRSYRPLPILSGMELSAEPGLIGGEGEGS